mgnify:CR=1 FL=1
MGDSDKAIIRLLSKRLKYVFLCFLFLPTLIQAQNFNYSRKAIKLYNQAELAFKENRIENAKELLTAAIAKEKKFLEAYIALGDIYSTKFDFQNAALNYKKVRAFDSKKYRYLDFKIAECLHKQYMFDEAKEYIRRYLNHGNTNSKYYYPAYRLQSNIDFALDLKSDDNDYQVARLSDSINTIYDEYLPSITVDGGLLIFTRAYPNYGRRVEDFFISRKDGNGEFGTANFLEGPFNTTENEGAQCTSADGNFLLFTACNRTDGYGSCDLYYSYKIDGAWTQPKNLGENINSSYWETQPAISPDGKTLYFVSNRPGGIGGMDLWKSTRSESGEWYRPVNMGAQVNTSEDEMSPFIHWDATTLYFGSKGWQGVGGYDLFMTKKIDSHSWSRPENVGFPVNTPFDDNSLMVEQDGRTAYFVSEFIADDAINLDIFTYQLSDDIKANPVAYLKGFVSNGSSVLKGAKISVFDLSADSLFYASNSDDMEGSFFVCMRLGKEYGIHIEKEGYLFYSENIKLDDSLAVNSKVERDFTLNKIAVGERIILDNIFFNFDSADLENKSNQEVEKIYKFLTKNKAIIVEIGGHTDNVGSREYNSRLSFQRAMNVKIALQNMGIGTERIQVKGYGETVPLKPNDTNANRDWNRRTELKIIE